MSWERRQYSMLGGEKKELFFQFPAKGKSKQFLMRRKNCLILLGMKILFKKKNVHFGKLHRCSTMSVKRLITIIHSSKRDDKRSHPFYLFYQRLGEK
ncbi:MAG: hypothetical protein DRP02_02020 [Candidatus Gerdarchaeota archaeon]|nr:MAG: hypothetical protein DRO63_06010 [Candidatus Gerdarchaeota archaeon]RLI72313.1 MAG: hypothetical protein DRP02_02020 [Candidatus Gerdarchaeota archaeon]